MSLDSLLKWENPQFSQEYCIQRRRIHRCGVSVDLKMRLGVSMHHLLGQLSPEHFLELLDDPATYAHIYEDALVEHLSTYIKNRVAALKANPSVEFATLAQPPLAPNQIAPQMWVDFDNILGASLGSALCPDESTRVASIVEQGIVLEKLRQAVEVLEVTCPSAHHVVTAMKRTVTVRTSSEPRFFYGSHPNTVGTVYMTNAHLHRVDCLKLVITLVHEAIHDTLFMLDRTQPLLVFEDAGKVEHPFSRLRIGTAAEAARAEDATNANVISKMKVTSPWTNQVLSLGAYVHAIFVWYGILNYLAISRCHGTFSEEQVESEYQWIKAGFQRQPMAQLEAFKAHLSPDTSIVLQTICEQAGSMAD